jgi:multiple sugar transport system ATP-binding protein
VAKVVLENVYKSFGPRGTKPAPRPTGTTVGGEVVAIASGDSSEAAAGQVSVLRRIQLTVNDGEFMVLVGPSGCGKSTLLRLIAGLETLTGGNIWVGDRLVNELPPKARDIAMVFQNYALYPHLSVYNNLAFGLRRTVMPPMDPPKPSQGRSLPPWLERGLVAATRPLPRSLRYWSARERAIDQRVLTVAEMLQIQHLLDRLPKQLSGGQKQRVALGRAMARNPAVFLMDEPLSNLDAKLRIETRSQIVNLQHRLGITTIYVTHDQTEAMTMGDRIAVMNGGQIQQIAPPLELYNHPVNRFVAEFIGTLPMNFMPVAVTAPLLMTHAQFRLTLPDRWETALRAYDGRSLILGIRPEHLSVTVPAPKNLPVTVERVEALGSETYLSVRLGHGPVSDRLTLQARIEPDRSVAIGEELWLAIAVDKIHLFDPETETAIG